MTAPPGLHTLARLHGIQTAYHDTEGRRITASPEALMATLRALGVELTGPAALRGRLEHRRRALWQRALDPVAVAWTPADRGLDGTGAGTARLRTPARLRDHAVRVTVGLEAGDERRSSPDPQSLEPLRAATVDGIEYIERALPLPAVPPGYHDLVVHLGTGPAARRYEAVLIAAPERAAGWGALPGVEPRGAGSPAWGLFAPLHSLHERASGAAPPDYPLLGRFAERTAELGGAAVGTLPLLAAFLDEPFEPSPYAPVSRLFWNGLYVAGEDGDGPDGHEEGPGPGRSAAPGDGLIDPAGIMAARRPALEAEARRFFGDGRRSDGERAGPAAEVASLGGPPELASFRSRNPLADDYARFRALTEARGTWDRWPDRLRARDVRPGDYDREVARYHLYVQWRAERQLAEVSERAASRGVSLYLDLPMGVHPRGYDVWRERALFASGASAGAPPDALAPGGQDWGFPPLHPEASRLQGHRYIVASIRKHLRFARVLRIDHVMQLHRMFWVPDGNARDGVYVKYPAEELYAILCLESRRAGAVIVGEDLGTVPRRVRRAMRRHGLPGMYVTQFELEDTTTTTLRPRRVRTGALASLGTHDTPTFAGWWWGEDIRIRQSLGEISEEDAEAQLAGRRVLREKLVRGLDVRGSTFDVRGTPGAADFPGAAGSPGAADSEAADSEALALLVQQALLGLLGRSGAGLVLAAVEDLWLEREPQNVPGTLLESNWRRRSKRPLEALSDPAVAALLRVLNEAREGSG